MNAIIWDFEHSVECAADRSFVWTFWTDVSNWERIEGAAVEWIRLEGPFAEGVRGATKMPEQEPQKWIISKLDLGRSATIEIQIEDCVFLNQIRLEEISGDQTRIVQRMTLAGEGERARHLAKGMRAFETSAPQGLAKLASAIEAELD